MVKSQGLFSHYTIELAREEIKLINTIWKEFDYAFQGIKWGTEGKKYLQENIAEEKLHDRGRPESCRRFLTITEAGKLFAVKQLIEYLFTDNIPDLKAYTYYRHSIYTAYSLVSQYRNELMTALNRIKDFNYQNILNIDYAGIESLA